MIVLSTFIECLLVLCNDAKNSMEKFDLASQLGIIQWSCNFEIDCVLYRIHSYVEKSIFNWRNSPLHQNFLPKYGHINIRIEIVNRVNNYK
jgi:hypothetical protein